MVTLSHDGKPVTTAMGLKVTPDAGFSDAPAFDVLHQARSVAMHMEYDWKPDGGFVRSRMADRYLSKSELQKAVDWPKDLAMTQQFSVGDEQHWKMRFHVTSATPASDLLQRIAKGIDQMPGWSHQLGGNRWISNREGRRVALSVATNPGPTAHDYQLEFRVRTQSN